MKKWDKLFEDRVSQIAGNGDPAHDLLHFKRVVSTAQRLCLAEGGAVEVVVPAAWLHDVVIIPKNDARRPSASRLSAEAARAYLETVDYPAPYLDPVAHAIEAHSFSADVKPQTLEARIVQDADRLDALGAIGIARCFATAGILQRSFYAEKDSFCENRAPDDTRFTIDHFYKKLFRIAETLQTPSGRREGLIRVAVMKQFMRDLAAEI